MPGGAGSRTFIWCSIERGRITSMYQGLRSRCASCQQVAQPDGVVGSIPEVQRPPLEESLDVLAVPGDVPRPILDFVDVVSGLAVLEVAAAVGRDQAEQTLDHRKAERVGSLRRGRLCDDSERAVEIVRAEPHPDATLERYDVRQIAATRGGRDGGGRMNRRKRTIERCMQLVRVTARQPGGERDEEASRARRGTRDGGGRRLARRCRCQSDDDPVQRNVRWVVFVSRAVCIGNQLQPEGTRTPGLA